MIYVIWGIVKGVGGWLLNNKLAALFLVLLLAASISLAVTKGALYIKSAQLISKQKEVEEQNEQIKELRLIQKENEANIVALKQYSEQLAALKQKTILVTEYLSQLPQETEEVLKSERVQKVNHCIFGWFVSDGVLPGGCYKSEGAVLPESSKAK